MLTTLYAKYHPGADGRCVPSVEKCRLWRRNVATDLQVVFPCIVQRAYTHPTIILHADLVSAGPAAHDRRRTGARPRSAANWMCNGIVIINNVIQ